MNLGEIYIKVSADTSAIDSMMTAFDKAARAAEEAGNRIDSAFSNAGKAASSTNDIGDSLEKAITKGNLFADAIESAFERVIDIAGRVASAFGNMVSDSVSAFAEFEQGSEALAATYGNSSNEFLRWMQDNSDTYGISLNDMVNKSVEMGAILNKANAQRRASDEAGEQASTEVQKQELSNRLQDLRASLSNQLSETREAQQAEYDSWKNHYAQLRKELSEQLQDEYDELKGYLDERVDAQRKANEVEYRERERALSDSYDNLKSALDAEVSAFSKATDARVKEINREYTERYKLIDEQKYAELKAIQDRIDAIDAEREAKKRALEDDKNNAKLSELQEKLASARLKSTRAKLQNDIEELQATMRSKSEDRALTDEKKSLQKQRDAVKDHYDDLKSELKEQQSEEVSAYKSARSEELEILKKNNSERLKEAKRANQDELQALRDAQQQTIDAMVAENESILKEKKRSNQQILDEQQAAQNEQLRSLKSSQSEQLREIQEHNRKVLQEQSNLIAQQKKALTEGSKATGNYAKVTEEDMKQSMMTMETLFKAAANIGARRNMDTSSVLDILNSVNYGRYATFDNLGLGYANKSGIQQLVADMNSKLEQGGKEGNLSADNYNDIVTALELLIDDMGIANLAAKESEETFSGSLNSLKAQWKNFVLSLGVDDTVMNTDEELNKLLGRLDTFVDQAMPIVTKIIDGVITVIISRGPEIVDTVKKSILDALPPEWQQKVEDFKATLDTIVTAMGPVIAIFASFAAASGINSIITLFSTLSGALANMPAVTSPLAGGFSGITASLTSFGETIALVIADGLGPLGDALLRFGAAGPIAFVAVIAGMIANSEKLRDVIGEVAGAIGGVLNDAFTMIQPILELVAGLWDRLNQALGFVGDKIAELVKPAFESFAEAIGPSWQGVVTTVHDILKGLADIILNVADVLGNILGPAIDVIVALLKPVLDFLGTVLGAVGGGFLTFLDMLLTAVKELVKWVADITKGWKEFFEGFRKEVDKFVENPGEWLKNAGKQIIEGLKKGIDEAWTNVTNFFKDIPGNIMNGLKEAFGIHSPSTKMAEIGNDVMEGFNQGSQGTPWENVKGFFGGIADTVGGFFSGAGSWLAEKGSNVIDGLKGGVDTAWNSVTSFFGGVHDNIASNFNGSNTWLEGHGNDVMAGLNDGITNMYKMVSDFMGQMQGNMESPFDGSESWLVGSGDEIISGLYSGLGRMWNMVNDWFRNLPDMISSVFSNAKDWLFGAGQNVISGFWDGLTDAFTGVQNWVGGVGEWIAQHKGPKQYDLKLLVPNGRWIMEGFEKGLRDQFPEIENAVSDISDLMSIDANMSVRRADNPWESGKVRGDNILNVYVGEMSVRSKDDIYSVSRELNSIWNREMNGAIA